MSPRWEGCTAVVVVVVLLMLLLSTKVLFQQVLPVDVSYSVVNSSFKCFFSKPDSCLGFAATSGNALVLRFHRVQIQFRYDYLPSPPVVLGLCFCVFMKWSDWFEMYRPRPNTILWASTAHLCHFRFVLDQCQNKRESVPFTKHMTTSHN